MAIWIIILVVIFFAIIIWIIVARKQKGRLEIIIHQDDFKIGDTIQGEIKIQAKKTIEAQKLVITLACDETSNDIDMDNSMSQSQTKRIYEENKELHQEKNYMTWEWETFKFQLTIPKEEDPKSKLGKAMKKASKFFSNKKITRKVESRLHAKGLDLTGRKKIKILNN